MHFVAEERLLLSADVVAVKLLIYGDVRLLLKLALGQMLLLK